MLLQGDDNLMRHREVCQFPWQAEMAELGFDSEALYRKRLEEAEFCSSRLYKLGATNAGPEYVFGPKPGKVLAKFGYVVNPPKHVAPKALLRGVAIGLQRQCNHIAPIRAVIERVLDLTKGSSAVFLRNHEEHMMKTRGHYHPTVDTMESLNEAYGWDYGLQAMLERDLQKMQLGDAWPSSISELLFDRDTAGVQGIFGSINAAGFKDLPEVCAA